MQNTRVLVNFLIKAAVVGLAVAFVVVWWNPTLLGAHTTSNPALNAANEPISATPSAPSASPSASQAAAASSPPVVMQSFADSVARAAPAVVNIYTARVVKERVPTAPFDRLFGEYWPSYRQRIERSLGSGVIVDAKGTIVTNQHVIAGADSIRVQLADGRIADATIVGQDDDTDIAILNLIL